MLELGIAHIDITDRVRRLRTNKLKTEREARDALIFAYGMRKVLGTTVYVAPGETEDCDFITAADVNDTRFYTCVQLKELAPEDLNPSQTLDDLIQRIAKYPCSDAVLAIHLNRRTQIPLSELAAIRVPFAELWFYWAGDPTASIWFLYGNVHRTPALYSFSYPEPEGSQVNIHAPNS